MLACTFAAGLLSGISSNFFVIWLTIRCLTHLRHNICHMGSISMYDENHFFLSIRYSLQYNVNMDFHSLLAKKFCMSCLLFVLLLLLFVCLFGLFKDFFMNTISVNSLHQNLISKLFKYNEKSF